MWASKLGVAIPLGTSLGSIGEIATCFSSQHAHRYLGRMVTMTLKDCGMCSTASERSSPMRVSVTP